MLLVRFFSGGTLEPVPLAKLILGLVKVRPVDARPTLGCGGITRCCSLNPSVGLDGESGEGGGELDCDGTTE